VVRAPTQLPRDAAGHSSGGGTCRLLALAQAADLRICVLTATQNQRSETKSPARHRGVFAEGLSDDMIRAMAYASRAGATARELAVTLDLSLSSVKRLLRTTNA
jgi:hypothetical protein